MNVIRCKNGHFFDGDSYGACPHCGEVATVSSAIPAKEEKKGFWGRGRKDKATDVQSIAPGNDLGNTPTDVMENYKRENDPVPVQNKDHTLDFWQTPFSSENNADNGHAKTASEGASPDSVNEAPVNERKDVDLVDPQPEIVKNDVQCEETERPEEPSPLRAAVKNASASNEGKTMSYFSSATSPASTQARSAQSSEPVVGWLVCVGGVHFGDCFNIYAGKNSVGRSDENRIVISKDNSISRIKHALIVYEPKKRNFYLQPGDSSGLTYLNDDYITESRKLAARDVIELGDSKLVFVPLCGENFSWEEYMPTGE